ncbi:MAG: hypothetical protein ABR521_14625 [Gaiellaceae bacterium]
MTLFANSSARIVALVGLVVIFGTVVAMNMSRARENNQDAAVASRVDQDAAVPARVPAPVPDYSGGKVDSGKAATPKPAAPRVNPVVAKAIAAGLPRSIGEALAANKVVVAVVYSPAAEVDRLVLDEATAGAASAGAGLVPVDVTLEGDSDATLLARKLGILDAPAVLVFGPSATLKTQIEGFADQRIVHQAAANAAL